jgi:UDP-2,3-diacylglucosamine pyrophosphatase LpxH
MKKVIQIDRTKSARFLLISDVHWDAIDCDRRLLKKHLDEAVATDSMVLINGDLFDLMQGRNDRRGGKGSIRPEFKVANYFDAVIEGAIEWFAPYAKHIAFVGYGNHESSCLKHNEIDPIAMFCNGLKFRHGSPVQIGQYEGYIQIGMTRNGSNSKHNFFIYYHHGFGGGGVVTKGVIQNQRKDASVEGVDCVWMGHVHELYHMVSVKDAVCRVKSKPIQRWVHHVRTASYKLEHEKGEGWHSERGAPPKPMGGYWLELVLRRTQEDYVELCYVEPTFTITGR